MDIRTRTRSTVLVAFVVTASMLLSTVALAHPVNQFGNPDCFGDRISHGSSSSQAHNGHELTPVDRAAALQGVVDDVLANGSEEEKALVMELFGETVSVQEFIRFVKLNCSDDPLFLPFQ